MNKKSFFLSAILLLVSIACVLLVSLRGTPIVALTNLENLPVAIDSFSATEDSFSEAVYNELDADFHLYRHYRSKDARQVDVYIGYYGTAKGGRTPHNPYGCLPSSGWAIVDTKRIKIATKTYSIEPDVNYILSKRQNEYSVMLHWYQSDGNKVLASGIQQNIQRFIGKVLYNKNDGAFVSISAVAQEGNIDDSLEMVSSFAGKVLDFLPHYWPVEELR